MIEIGELYSSTDLRDLGVIGIVDWAEELTILTALPCDRRSAIWQKILPMIRVVDMGYHTPCWMWQGSTSGNGRGGDYPRMALDGQTVAVHKVTWTNENGFIPGKKQLDHLCKQRCCVRPSHLELVTHKENQRRRDASNGVVRRKKRK